MLAGLLSTGGHNLAAQSKPADTAADAIWSSLQVQLEQTPTDSVDHLAIPLVRKHCGDTPSCQFSIYEHIMVQLERESRILAAISICKEMENVALLQGDSTELGYVYLNLSRYYHALGVPRMGTIYVDKAQAIFERHGSYFALVQARMFKLENSLSHRDFNDVMANMDSLLADATQKGETQVTYYLYTRLIHYKINGKRYDEASRHIAALEQMPISEPPTRTQLGKLTIAARARGRLALIRKSPDEAEAFYQKALKLLEINADPWMEVSTLISLTELEWTRGNRTPAKAYLNRAEARAIEGPVEDLLADVYAWNAEIAEKEGRLAQALEYTKKHHTQKEAYQNRSAGFDLQNYYLQQEKEQLASEKKNQELELRLNKVQLRNSLFLAAFILTLAAFLLFAYFKQRTAKRALTTQNTFIQQQAEQLKSLDAAKSRFFANVSHELRTPLTLLQGPIRTLLKENRLSEKQIHLLQMADRSGAHLQQLVNEILDLRKLEMGQIGLQEKPTRLLAFFQNYFAQFESFAEGKQIDLSFNFQIAPDLIASLDQEKCHQILNNLLSNAFKFTPEGGQIEANMSVTDGMLHLRIADSGPGIHPDDLPHVFDRFFQTNRPDKPAEGGTGIGLNLCQEYARLFGGDISVESTLGKGSVFYLDFPLQLLDTAQQMMQFDAESTDDLQGNSNSALMPGSLTDPASDTFLGKPAAVPASDQQPTILVVEDNPGLQDYIRLIVSEKYKVVTAEHGQSALEILEHTQVGLILSDLMMPVMDGYQLLEKLKSDDATCHIPVIMLTARAEVQDKLKALRIGVDDYLLKPFDEEELLVRIDNLLKNQANRRQEIPAESQQEDQSAVSQEDREWLETFEHFVKKNLPNDTVTVAVLAHEFTMSESTLLRQLKRLTGLTPVQYLQEMRLNEARHLLENRVYNSIALVATKVGYGDARSFTRSFRARFGKLPSEVFQD